MPLPYAFNKKKCTINSVKDILEIPHNSDLQLVSLDIVNMCSIVPVN